MEQEQVINTSQNVNIGLNIAGIGDRILAIIIDYLIQMGLTIGLVFLAGGVFEDSIGTQIIIMAITSFIIFLYFFFCEWLLHGQSIGKRYLKLKVIHVSGAQATVSQLLVRNLVRIVDCICGIGLLVLFISKRSQRLGDLAAGTVVVSLRDNISLNDTIHVDLKDGYEPEFMKIEILRLNERDLELIKEVINRKEKDLNWDVINILATSLKKKTGVQGAEKLQDDQFLKALLSDYQYYGSVG